MARFVVDQRTNYQVPVAFTCALLGISISWFYKWLPRTAIATGLYTKRDLRRDTMDRAVKVMFDKNRGLHGSPRLVLDLREEGWTVSEKTVANSMRRQGLIARKIKRRNGLTKQDKSKAPFPDLIRRDFTATAVNQRWVGDITEIPTAAGKLYLATVIDLYSRRLIGAATSLHPNAELAKAAITMAVTVRGGKEAIWKEEESERSFSTLTAARPTPRICSPAHAETSGSANPWDASDRASIMRPRRRSSPASSGKSSPATSSETPPKPLPWSRTGAGTSTTPTAATAPHR
nr:DDE-type integrase/transposase/recombinase [Ornithinibacter aureus]